MQMRVIINSDIVLVLKKAAEAAFFSLIFKEVSLKINYQIETRFSGAIYIASPSLTSKVS